MGGDDHKPALLSGKPINMQMVVDTYPIIKSREDNAESLHKLFRISEILITRELDSAAWLFEVQADLLKQLLEWAKANNNDKLINCVSYSLVQNSDALADNAPAAAKILPLLGMPILNPADINLNLNGSGARSKKLGEGANSVVVSAEFNKKPAALKIDVLDNNILTYQEALTYTNIETRGGHPNITKFYGMAIPRILVLELCEKTLTEMLVELKDKPSHEKAIYALGAIQQLASALIFLSKSEIIVADLELKNILVREDGTLAICDLANALFSFQLNDPFYHLQHLTTLTAAAPETIVLALPDDEQEEAVKEYKITPGNNPTIDIYSLGVVALSLYFAAHFNLIPYVKADNRREMDAHDPTTKAKNIATYYLDYIMQHHEHGWPRIKADDPPIAHAFNTLARKMYQPYPKQRITPGKAKEEADQILATYRNK